MSFGRPAVVEGAEAEKLYAAGGGSCHGKTQRFFVGGTDLIDAARRAAILCAKTGISLTYVSESSGFGVKASTNGKVVRRGPGRPRKHKMPMSERKSHGNRYTTCPDCKKEVLARTIRQHRGAHRGGGGIMGVSRTQGQETRKTGLTVSGGNGRD